MAVKGKTEVISPLNEAFVRKLERVMALSTKEKQAVARLPMTIRAFRSHQDIVLDGDCLSQCCLIIEGWACRYRILREGRRQITAFNIVGDMPDLYGLHVPVADHGLAALTPTWVGFVPHSNMCELIEEFPSIAAALWREAFAEMTTLREWLVGIGSRPALDRTAHLLCELYLKLHAAGLAADYRCDLPITQLELANALGLSGVHVNRTLQELRKRGLIALRNGEMIIHDWTALTETADFDPPSRHWEEGSRSPHVRSERFKIVPRNTAA